MNGSPKKSVKRLQKRSVVFVAFAVVLIGATVTYQNCEGTRTRTSDISVSTAEAESNLSNLLSQVTSATSVTGNSASTEATALNTAITFAESSGVTLYYAESPLMGPTDVVDPIDYGLLFSTGTSIGTPSQTQMYFAFSNANGAQGDLILSGYSASIGSTGSTTSTTAATSNKAKMAMNSVVKLATSPAPTAAASATPSSISINFVQVGINDGSNGLSAGTIDSDNGMVMDMTMSDGTAVRLRSQDTTDDGDLADVIQISIYQVDSSGNENYAGQINFINTGAN